MGQRYMVEVRGEWAGLSGGWRPACSGTENQTGESDEEASTFDDYASAHSYMDELQQRSGDEFDDESGRAAGAPEAPRFNITVVEAD